MIIETFRIIPKQFKTIPVVAYLPVLWIILVFRNPITAKIRPNKEKIKIENEKEMAIISRKEFLLMLTKSKNNDTTKKNNETVPNIIVFIIPLGIGPFDGFMTLFSCNFNSFVFSFIII